MADDLEQQLQAFRDIEAIKQLKASYIRLADAQEWDAWGALLTDDFHFDTDGGVIEGRDAVVAMVRENLTGASTVHHVFTPEITLTGPDTAHAIWPMEDWVRMELNGAPFAFHGMGHYTEDYVRTADGWRIKKCVGTRQRIDPIDGSEMIAAHEDAAG